MSFPRGHLRERHEEVKSHLRDSATESKVKSQKSNRKVLIFDFFAVEQTRIVTALDRQIP